MQANPDVIRMLEEYADLMEIRGENSFRVNAHRRAARSIEDLAVDIREVAARGELTTIPGIGQGIAEKISEFLQHGKVAAVEELKREIPPTLLELLRIPGLGPKKAALLWKERGIRSLDDLKAAIAAGKLADLKGFGAKTVEHIQQGIEFLGRTAGRTRLSTAAAIADELCAALREVPGVLRLEPAGSLRRGCETVGDIDIVCAAQDGAAVIRRFTKLPGVQQVLAEGDTKGSVRVDAGKGRTIQVDLRVVPEESYGAALQYFTGSKAHNIRLRERAQERGWTLNEYALSDGKKVLAGRTEKEIYDALELPLVPPEMREDRGELDLKHAPRDLLKLEDIRGDLHLHTDASDGRDTLEAMVAAARERGYEYLNITDHSPSSVIANGLKPERLREQIRRVRALAATLGNFTLWVGAEVDILLDGRLDYEDALLAELDFVVASVHAGMGQDMHANTRRTLAAIRNPYVNVIGHPTGRLINRRDAMPLDIEAIVKEAARTGTALEINASPYRLDLKDQHARLAREYGVMICIDTDAHATGELDQMRFGVITARRAWLRKGDVLNTHSAAEIAAFVKRKRAAAMGAPGPSGATGAGRKPAGGAARRGRK